MNILFEQSGGFVAGIKRPAVTIDTTALSPAEALSWRELVAASDFFALPACNPTRTVRDAFTYQVTINDGNQSHSISFQDGQIPASAAPLIERLRQAALRKPGP